MYDAAWPPGHPPAWPVVAGYLGGDTPHVWSAAEWDHQPARYRLPIWVRDNPGAASVSADSAAAVTACHKLGVPRGATIALDFETAVNAAYVTAFDHVLTAAGYGVMLYGSLSTVRQNPAPSRGYWVADWTGTPHLVSGAAATQYAGSKAVGGAYDSSVIATTVPLWDTHPAPHPPPPPHAGPTSALDENGRNTSPGAQVCREVWNTDGVFSVPADWNPNGINPYWTPANVLTHAVNVLHTLAADVAALKNGQH